MFLKARILIFKFTKSHLCVVWFCWTCLQFVWRWWGEGRQFNRQWGLKNWSARSGSIAQPQSEETMKPVFWPEKVSTWDAISRPNQYVVGVTCWSFLFPVCFPPKHKGGDIWRSWRQPKLFSIYASTAHSRSQRTGRKVRWIPHSQEVLHISASLL